MSAVPMTVAVPVPRITVSIMSVIGVAIIPAMPVIVVPIVATIRPIRGIIGIAVVVPPVIVRIGVRVRVRV
jgi:hypothetical protein